MDDFGKRLRYHPPFGNFLRRCYQWELAIELLEIHRTAMESRIAQGLSNEVTHHALAVGDAKMLYDILPSHAWGMFNHSELGLLKQSLSALSWSNLLKDSYPILL